MRSLLALRRRAGPAASFAVVSSVVSACRAAELLREAAGGRSMANALLVLQWAVSIVGVGCYAMLIREVFREYRWWAVPFVLFPPALLFVYVPTRWRRCMVPFLVFIACFAMAMALQRARLGYWAWPDVGRSS
jgi:hypothetical protein